jgi:hypothetical protein
VEPKVDSVLVASLMACEDLYFDCLSAESMAYVETYIDEEQHEAYRHSRRKKKENHSESIIQCYLPVVRVSSDDPLCHRPGTEHRLEN